MLALISLMIIQSSDVYATTLRRGESIGNLVVRGANGKDINLGKLKSPAVVVFFIPNREDSLKELKALAKIAKSKKHASYKYIAVFRGSSKEEKKMTVDFIKKNKLPFTLAFDPSTTVTHRFGVSAFPTFFLIDQKGVLRTIPMSRIAKYRKLSYDDMMSMVENARTIPYIDMMDVDARTNNVRAMIGKPIPEFKLRDTSNRPLSVTANRGKKNLILVFWSPTCSHCKAELPKLQRYYSKYGKKYNFEVITVTQPGGPDGKRMIDDIVHDNMLSFPALIDENGSTMQLYGIQFVPSVFFVNKRGEMVEYLTGEARDFDLVYNSVFEDFSRMK